MLFRSPQNPKTPQLIIKKSGLLLNHMHRIGRDVGLFVLLYALQRAHPRLLYLLSHPRVLHRVCPRNLGPLVLHKYRWKTCTNSNNSSSHSDYTTSHARTDSNDPGEARSAVLVLLPFFLFLLVTKRVQSAVASVVGKSALRLRILAH